jgi:hypothetical protein
MLPRCCDLGRIDSPHRIRILSMVGMRDASALQPAVPDGAQHSLDVDVRRDRASRAQAGNPPRGQSDDDREIHPAFADRDVRDNNNPEAVV